jgi:Tfp pilus assembly protein FimT
MRHAHTLIELTITLALVSLMAAIATPSLVGTTERWRLRAAAADIVNALVLTRELALARGTTATFVVDHVRGEVRVTSGGGTIARRAIVALHGVTLAASGDSVRFGPDGLATGVSNTTLLIGRGTRIDSVVVSRLGRIRWAGN